MNEQQQRDFAAMNAAIEKAMAAEGLPPKPELPAIVHEPRDDAAGAAGAGGSPASGVFSGASGGASGGDWGGGGSPAGSGGLEVVAAKLDQIVLSLAMLQAFLESQMSD